MNHLDLILYFFHKQLYMSNKYSDIINKQFLKLVQLKNELLKDNEYMINVIDNLDENILDVYSDKIKFFSCTYELLGSYDINTNIFIWGNDHTIVNMQYIKNILHIRKESKKIEDIIINIKYDDLGYLERLYYYVTHNIFIISTTNINELMEFCVSSSETKGVVAEKKDNKITFYLIVDIIST